MKQERCRVRTDLAVEERERFPGTETEIEGVALEKKELPFDIVKTVVEIRTDKGAELMHKPVGTYVTLERMELWESGEEIQEAMAKEVAECLAMLCAEKTCDTVLVAGLGNRSITADALGPLTAEKIKITRAVGVRWGENETGHCKYGTPGVCALAPGVLMQTGVESADIIKGIVKEIGATLVIAIDALAAGNSRRLNNTIQISDTGICPGSGVGNHRNAITAETIGVPVIGVGIPTVIDGATIVHDTMERLIDVCMDTAELKALVTPLVQMSGQEKYELFQTLLRSYTGDMIVTPKDVDESVCVLSAIVASGINGCFSSYTDL